MLTRKQYELLMFINRRLNDTGVSPSFDEMKEALDLKSKSGIHRLITSLEERGFLRRLAHKARALQVLKLPEAAAIYPSAVTAFPPPENRRSGTGMRDGDVANGFTPQLINGGLKPGLPGVMAAQEAGAISLPLYGRIAAGTPIEALRDNSTTIDVPLSLLGKGTHYALEVAGDSMIDAGIQDGDVAIIQNAETAENGQIVVALVDEQEATLKRLRRKGASIALEPANPAYETRIFGPDRVKIQGKLVGLFRRF
ncbi:MAG: transcriptional repressor LexA [Rhodospirillales bacterium]